MNNLSDVDTILAQTVNFWQSIEVVVDTIGKKQMHAETLMRAIADKAEAQRAL